MVIPNPIKLKNVPQSERAEVLDLCAKMQKLRLEQYRLQEELRQCLVQEWTKMDEITITFDKLLSLMRAYHRAVEGGKEQFTWEGKEFVTAYAKYLLEYGESCLYMDDSQRRTLKTLRLTHQRVMSNRENKDGT